MSLPKTVIDQIELQITTPHGFGKTMTTSGSKLVVGSLLSNHVVIEDAGIDPIHAMFERSEDGSWHITDLGSASGVKVNGLEIDVERTVVRGDVVEIGDVMIVVHRFTEQKDVRSKTIKTDNPAESRLSRLKPLFNQNRAQISGPILEVVVFWGQTVLEMEHFHHEANGFERVVLDDSGTAHFLGGSKERIKRYELAKLNEDDNCLVYLRDGMEATLGTQGKRKNLEGERKLRLRRDDFLRIKDGALEYFLHYTRNPSVKLPDLKKRDQLLFGLGIVAALMYLCLVIVALNTEVTQPQTDIDDIWGPIFPTEEKKREFRIVEVKRQLPNKKPPPTIAKVRPASPIKPAATPKPRLKRDVAKKLRKPVIKKILTAHQPEAGNRSPSKAPAKPSTHFGERPKFALKPVGDLRNKKIGPTGGPRNSLNSQRSAKIKGKNRFDNPGFKGGVSQKPSTTNLHKLRKGFGAVLQKTGVGAMKVNFDSGGDGIGKRRGTGTKTQGLGGLNTGKSLKFSGVNGSPDGWGPGSGGPYGGRKGKGVDGLSDILKGGTAFGYGPGKHGRVIPKIPPQDPVIHGSNVSKEAILMVIRANLNQIRHCYEKTLSRSPNTAGKMTVGFSIVRTGRVGSVEVISSTIRDSQMRSCITGAIRRWDFSLVKGSFTKVTYPFIFTPAVR